MALAVAQVTGSTAAGSTTITVTFGSATTTGSLIVGVGCVFNTGTGATAGDVTDSKSNSYSLGANSFGGASLCGIAGYYNNAGTRGSSHSLTLNLTGSAGESDQLGIIEITGQDSSTPYDSTTAATANDTTSPFAVTASAAISGNQIAIYGVSVAGDTGNPAWTGPSGYTVIGSANDAATTLVYYTGYKINETGTPSPSATWTGTVSESPRELFMSFKEAAGGAAATDSIDQPTITSMDLSWPVRSLFDPLPLPVTIIPVWVDATVTATSDVNTTGQLDLADLLYATVTADRSVVAMMPTAAPQYATVTGDRNVAAHLPAADPLYATISADRNVAAHLPAATFLLNGAYASGFPTIGLLFTGAPHYVTVTADRSVAAHLPTAAPPYSTVSHNANVAAHLPTAAPLWALVSGASDLNTIGLLFTGDIHRAAVTADRTITATRAVIGRLDVGGPLYGVVTHQVSLVGHLPLAVVQYAPFQLLSTLPIAARTATALLEMVASAQIGMTATGLLYVTAGDAIPQTAAGATAGSADEELAE